MAYQNFEEKKTLVRMCKIDRGSGMLSLVTISVVFLELSKDQRRGPFRPTNGAGVLTRAPLHWGIRPHAHR